MPPVRRAGRARSSSPSSDSESSSSSSSSSSSVRSADSSSRADTSRAQSITRRCQHCDVFTSRRWFTLPMAEEYFRTILKGARKQLETYINNADPENNQLDTAKALFDASSHDTDTVAHSWWNYNDNPASIDQFPKVFARLFQSKSSSSSSSSSSSRPSDSQSSSASNASRSHIPLLCTKCVNSSFTKFLQRHCSQMSDLSFSEEECKAELKKLRKNGSAAHFFDVSLDKVKVEDGASELVLPESGEYFLSDYGYKPLALAGGEHSNKTANRDSAKVHGKFSAVERKFLEEFINRYCAENGVNRDDLLNVHIGRSSTDGEDREKSLRLKHHWKHIAAALPQRSTHSIYTFAKRQFSNLKTGSFSEEEREMVKSFVAQHGTKWTAIARQLGRHPISVRDGYREWGSVIKHDQWTEEEDEELLRLVKKFLRISHGLPRSVDDSQLLPIMLKRNQKILFGVIGQLLKRSKSDCKLRYYNRLWPRLTQQEADLWSRERVVELLHKIRDSGAEIFEDIDWDSVNPVPTLPAYAARLKMEGVLRTVPNYRKRGLESIITTLIREYEGESAAASSDSVSASVSASVESASSAPLPELETVESKLERKYAAIRERKKKEQEEEEAMRREMEMEKEAEQEEQEASQSEEEQKREKPRSKKNQANKNDNANAKSGGSQKEKRAAQKEKEDAKENEAVKDKERAKEMEKPKPNQQPARPDKKRKERSEQKEAPQLERPIISIPLPAPSPAPFVGRSNNSKPKPKEQEHEKETGQEKEKEKQPEKKKQKKVLI